MPLFAAITPQEQAHGMLLLICALCLGLLGIGIMVGLIIARRRLWRRMQADAKRKAQVAPVDPWFEAGRRMDVPPEDSGDLSPESNPDTFTQP